MHPKAFSWGTAAATYSIHAADNMVVSCKNYSVGEIKLDYGGLSSFFSDN